MANEKKCIKLIACAALLSSVSGFIGFSLGTAETEVIFAENDCNPVTAPMLASLEGEELSRVELRVSGHTKANTFILWENLTDAVSHDKSN